MRRSEIFVPLTTDFPDNRKVRALSRYGRDARPARDLYVQMLLYCKRTKSDGFVPEEQLGLLAYPDPVKYGRRDADHLADVGLIERGTGGWLLPGWLERNPSRASIDAKSEAKSRGARHANHKRWHSETADPDCEWCRTTDQTSDQISDQTTDDVPNIHRSQSESTETETETETEVKTLARQAGRPPEPGSDDDPDWVAFWDAYPRKVSKAEARKAWKSAVAKRKADPAAIIAAAARYDADRTRTDEFTAYPATWLNGDRWHDYGPRTTETAGARQAFPWEN
jgi:hypothetical protein